MTGMPATPAAAKAAGGSILALACSLFFGACVPSPTGEIAELGGKTLRYLSVDSGYNGHDYGSFAFNAAGDGGSYELFAFEYDYPSAAAEAEGHYAGRTWIRRGGERGSFSYDRASGALASTPTDVFYMKEDAVSAYEGDFEYIPYLEYYQRSSGDPAVTAAEKSSSRTVVFFQDNLVPAYFSGDAGWRSVSVERESFTSGGQGYAMETRREETLGVTAASVVSRTEEAVVIEDPSGRSAAYWMERYAFSVDAFHAVGTGPEPKDFDAAWKKGKALTLDLTKAEYVMATWDDGHPAPDAPEIDETDGISEANAPADPSYYYRDANRDLAISISVAREEDHIVMTDYLVLASRTAE